MAQGVQTTSLRLRFVIQIAVLAIAARYVDQQGIPELVLNHVYTYNPFQEPCGLLSAKQFVILSDNVVTADANVTLPGLVHVQGRRIVAVITSPSSTINRLTVAQPFLAWHPNITVLDYGSAVVGPGLIDVHVHMNEPGREEWEGIETATSAAAAGGITTVIDMPLNSDPCTTNVVELAKKIDRVKRKAKVDVGLWAGLVPENADKPKQLQALIHSGALGFKAFMAPSGINDFPNVEKKDLEVALPTIKKLGVPLLLHAEVVDDNVPNTDSAVDVRAYSTWLNARPPRFETNALQMVIDVLSADNTTAAAGFNIHIVHVSEASLLSKLVKARAAGLPLTWETCAHYLTFAAEDVADGDTRFKCAPPLRSAANKEALWEALKEGKFDALSTDHSPAPPELKKLVSGDFIAAWGGIAGLQYALPATWHGMQEHGMSPVALHSLWSSFPAKLAGLNGKKGALNKGAAADIVVWSMNEYADTSSNGLYHRHKVTPYADMQLKGRVLATFVGGSQVFSEEKGVEEKHLCGHAVLKRTGVL